MTKIRITGGRYGYISPAGTHSVKTPNDPPFDVEDSEAERLVKLGVAEINGERGNATGKGGFAKGKADTHTDDKEPLNDEGESSFEYDENTSAKDLREIGKKIGISFPVGTTKADMIAALDAYVNSSDDDSGDDLDLGVEMPEA